MSCDNILGCSSIAGRGLLKAAKDASVTDVRSINQFNAYEVQVLKDYLTSKDITVQQMWNECIEKVESGDYTYCPPGRTPLTPDTVLCSFCLPCVVSNLALKYRWDIDPEELPEEIRSRPNCWWGPNCRTQLHNANHCRTRNHICTQTRF